MIANIVDFETYCACKMVSRNFRDLCQENLRIGNNAVTVVPNPDTRSYTQVPESTMVIHTGIIDRASEHDVVSCRVNLQYFASSKIQRVFLRTFLYVLGEEVAGRMVWMERPGKLSSGASLVGGV